MPDESYFCHTMALTQAVSSLNFPVIRGIQSGREYYVTMWTFRLMRQISIFDEKELPPELRAQRIINKSRIPEIANYILNNPKDYVFSAITASIDSEVEFTPLSGEEKIGILRVPMEAKFIINDGQHRRAAILAALDQRPELAYETIPVVFFLDVGLARSQQMFSDLNRYAIRPSRSISLLYDHRSEKSNLARRVVAKSSLFRDIVDYEKSSLAPRSRKLFTLSAFYNACSELIQGISTGNVDSDAKVARDYWEAVALQFPVWKQVLEGTVSAGEVREGFVHAHGIALQAMGRMGNALLRTHPDNWSAHLPKLKVIDWSKKNTSAWEGRTLLGGRLSKTHVNVLRTSAFLKRQLDLPLTAEEQDLESNEFSKSNGKKSKRKKRINK